MNTLFEASFQIVPVPQGRPRMCRVGSGVRAVDPPKSRIYKETLQQMAKMAKPQMITDTPLNIVLQFVLPVPSSWSKKKQAKALAGEIVPQGKPDLDNLIKAVLDAMNDIVWEDDSAIVEVAANKVYGDTPLVRMVVYEHEVQIY